MSMPLEDEPRLSPREMEVARLVSMGNSNREVARLMHISEHTVKNYLFRVFEKLGASNRVEVLLYFSRRNNLHANAELDPPPAIQKRSPNAFCPALLQKPPRFPKFLLLLIPKNNREHLLGDLEEEFHSILVPEFGVRKAGLWFWWHVCISIGPLLWAKVKRVVGIVWLWKSVR